MATNYIQAIRTRDFATSASPTANQFILTDGSDQAASIETNALRNFVESVRAIPDVLGSGEKVLSEAEKKVREKLRITVQG